MVEPTRPAPRWITPRMLAEPWCFQIRGAPRVATNRAAWELAHRVNPDYAWLDIVGQDDSVDPEEPSASGLVPTERLYKTLDPSSLKPDNTAANLAMWFVIRPDASPQTLHPLTDFLRLPAVIQEVIGGTPTSGRQGVVVVANADRLAQYYPDEADSIAPLLNVWRNERVSLVTTYCNLARKTRFLNDYVFEVKSSEGTSWKSCSVTLERAPHGEDLRVGATLPLLEG